jgi:hypothetical protein
MHRTVKFLMHWQPGRWCGFVSVTRYLQINKKYDPGSCFQLSNHISFPLSESRICQTLLQYHKALGEVRNEYRTTRDVGKAIRQIAPLTVIER